MSLKMLEALLFAALGYVMGSVMNGYLLPKYLKGIDITKVSEDHNPGTANVMKYAGVPVGILCFLPDFWLHRSSEMPSRSGTTATAERQSL